MEQLARPKIYFIRHGETDWNVAGRMQGQQDIPLNATGRKQSEQLSGKLLKLVEAPEKLDYIVSPMRRTRETADILMHKAGLDPASYKVDPRLREITFGEWEGLTWKEVRARDPELARIRDMDKWGTVSPGGESYAMLADRVRPLFEELKRDTVIVSHGGVARATLAVLGYVAPHDAPIIDIWQGRILQLTDSEYRWV
jgi:Fructose-2,6-bisphosphatase